MHIGRGDNGPLGHRPVRLSSIAEVDAGAVVEASDPIYARDERQLIGAAVVRTAGQRLDEGVQPGGADVYGNLTLVRSGLRELLEARRLPQAVQYGCVHAVNSFRVFASVRYT